MKKLLLITLIVFFVSVPCFAAQFLVEVPAAQKMKTNKKATLQAAYSLQMLIGDEATVALLLLLDIEKVKNKHIDVTDDLLWNTKVHGNSKLINYTEENITLEELQARIDLLDLGWEILAANDGCQKDEHEDFILDANGDKIINTILAYDPNIVRKYILNEETPGAIEFGKIQGTLTLEGEDED